MSETLHAPAKAASVDAAALIAFVHREARLLDERRYDEWVGLYLPEARYWVPVSREQTSPRDGPSHFHDDIQLMSARVHRLANPRVFAAEPAPRTLHVVSGVEIEPDGEGWTATSAQIMAEWRDRGGYEADQRLFAGRVTHALRFVDGRIRIALKRVDLINAEGPFNAMAAPL